MSLNPQQRGKLLQVVDNAIAKSDLKDDPEIKAIRSIMARFRGDTSAKNIDLGSLLRVFGIGLDLGGVNVGFSGPEVSVNSPLGRIGCGFLRGTASSSSAGNNSQKPSVGGEDEVDDLKRLS